VHDDAESSDEEKIAPPREASHFSKWQCVRVTGTVAVIAPPWEEPVFSFTKRQCSTCALVELRFWRDVILA
jgi:hypothetical protein